MDKLALLIVEFGRILSDPVLTTPTKSQQTTALFLYDALGIMFMQNSGLPVDSVEFSWLALRAKYLVEHAELLLGKRWQALTPWAASVLTAASATTAPTAR
jgi:hypothetical protein